MPSRAASDREAAHERVLIAKLQAAGATEDDAACGISLTASAISPSKAATVQFATLCHRQFKTNQE